ncbi:MAG: PEP-CTERM system histidine kinase PrsK [Methyloprofundus sp.]|nr:PEP-CTERM system histidine kinase PrsK [Methyloprofundus sp.]
MEIFALYSYSIGLLVFLVLLPWAIFRFKKNAFVPQFILAIVASIVWMGAVVYAITHATVYIADVFIFETLRNAVWFFFLGTLISRQLFQGNFDFLIRSRYTLFLIAWVLFSGAVELSVDLLDITKLYMSDIRLFTHLSFSIIGLILVEQLYRSVNKDQRWAIKYLCLGLAAIFSFDFIVFSKSILFERLDFVLWNSRGLINALCVPLLAISFTRLQDSEQQVTISHTVVMHTTVLFGTGLYMILMSLAGFYIKDFGGVWSDIIQTFFIFLAVLLVVVVFTTGKIRAYLKVYFNTHFFQHNYDYREEWIKLSREIASLDSWDELTQFVIKTLANLAGSRGGGLWLVNDTGQFYFADEQHLGFSVDTIFQSNDAFIQFLNEKQWVIDFCEFENTPEIYDDVDLSAWLGKKNIWMIIPLFQKNKMLAFVVLSNPLVKRQINHEDHDLLKTVGLQLANALALSKVSDDLSRARQFEAYSRFSAFLVHDLKNLVAQVSMIVRNAEQHRHNPEFIDDAIDTLENVVNKMEYLLAQLKKGQVKEQQKITLNIPDVLADIVLQQAGNLPKLSVDCRLSECLIRADQQRFIAILGHLVQNAQDATADDGIVKIHVAIEAGYALIDIIDTGVGMDQKFISERLFRPFDTTKGNAGMGIGVYEVREYILNESGMIAVESELGVGTVFSLKYPLISCDTQGNINKQILI